MGQKGIIHLLPLLLVAAVVITLGLLWTTNLSFKQKISDTLRPMTGKSSEIAPKAEYKNPLELSSQYVNPFASYKNPFDAIK